ncbi:MAG: hypothetical protein K8T20_19585 [Planctomycetes bacterium]|nr:hypothetical protein [Planctomycetota bacterium]
MTTPGLKEALQLLELEASRYCVGLAYDFAKFEPEENQAASGVLVRWNGRTFILTAGHFVGDKIAEGVDVVFPRESFGSPSIPLDEPLPRSFSGPAERSRVIRPLRLISNTSDLDDVGAIEIEAEAVPSYSRVYELPSTEPPRPAVGDEIFFFGFPRSHQMTVTNGADGALARGSVALLTRVQPDPPPGTWLDEDQRDTFDPAMHFLGTVDPAEMPHGDKLDLHGMSGCGVWRRKKIGQVWSSASELLGVQVSVFRYRMKFNRLGGILGQLRE